MSEKNPHEDSSDEWQAHLETETRGRSRDRERLPEVVVVGLTVLSHPDPARVGEVAALPRLARGEDAELSRHQPKFAPPDGGIPRPLADPRISRRPLRLIPGPAGSLCLVTTDSPIAVEVDGQPVHEQIEISAKDLEGGVGLLLSDRVALLLHLLRPAVIRPPHFGLVGESSAMVSLRREIERLADLSIPVLLRGESGTGKELVARAIQGAGPRRDQPFLSINMGAIPPSLAAAELFGAAKGSFSGADRKRGGYFERADGGTLFLDEVGDMPPEVQVLLLRALETGEIQPVGAERPHRVDVRLLAATDSDLEHAIATGAFKAPLLHRLSGYEIFLPPLKRRADDVGRLFFHFLRRELEVIGEADRLLDAGPHGRPFIPAALLVGLARCPWPGNVRQLRNVVRQLVVANRGSETLVVPPRVGELLSAGPKAEAPEARAAAKTYRDPGDIGEEELREALKAHRWQLLPACRHLGISRSSLYALIESSPTIRKARDLSRTEIEASASACDGQLERMVDALEVSKQGLKMRMKELGLR